MFKKLGFLLLLMVAVATFNQPRAAAPLVQAYHALIDTVTITAEFATKFQEVSSVIWVTTDSAYIWVTVSGIAILDPNERLYFGWGNDSANRVDSHSVLDGILAHSNLDTMVIHNALGNLRGKTRVPFSFTRIDSVITQTDITDTTYINMATGASTSNVEIEDFVIKCVILNLD